MPDPDVAWVCRGCGTFNDGQSASCAVCMQARGVDPASCCPACGAVAANGGDRFCRTCGASFGASTSLGDANQFPPTQAVAPPTGPGPLAAPPPPSVGFPASPPLVVPPAMGPSSGGQSPWLWAALAAVVVVVVAVAAVMFLGRSAPSGFSYVSEDANSGVRRTTSTSSTTSTAVAARPVTTSPSSAVATPDGGAAFVTGLDGILQASKSSRSSLGALLDDVRSCAQQPWDVQQPILDLADERGRTLDQVNALDTGGSADASRAKSLLVSALTASQESDTHYASVVGRMTGCGTLPTTDADFIAARDNSDPAASSAKAEFVAVYNPLAARFGAKSNWVESEI